MQSTTNLLADDVTIISPASSYRGTSSTKDSKINTQDMTTYVVTYVLFNC